MNKMNNIEGERVVILSRG